MHAANATSRSTTSPSALSPSFIYIYVSYATYFIIIFLIDPYMLIFFAPISRVIAPINLSHLATHRLIHSSPAIHSCSHLASAYPCNQIDIYNITYHVRTLRRLPYFYAPYISGSTWPSRTRLLSSYTFLPLRIIQSHQ